MATCTALQLLDGFGGEMEARDAEIEQELADGYDPALTYRQARWFFYRQYVFLAHGYLGKGNRVRIPDCVVAAIRARYPDPQCTCASTQEFVRCDLYTGYRASDSQQ